jgi:hypothetical protein
MNRRQLLQGMLAGGTFAATAASMGRAVASSSTSGKKVLEIFLDGGFSAFDTLLYSERYRTHATPTPGVKAIADEVALQAQTVTMPALPVGTPSQQLWASQHALGPLGDVNHDLFTQWRIVAMQHPLTAHPVATPYTLTGTRLGRPYHAGMAAAVRAQHGSPLAQPSWILYPGGAVKTGLIAAQTDGLSGSSYPVLVPFDAGADVDVDAFARGPESRDGVVAALRNAYADRTRYTASAQGAALRNDGLKTYEGARSSLETASSGIRTPLIAALQQGGNSATDRVRTGLELLRGGARYVAVVHSGFDTHGLDQTQHGAHHRNALRSLLMGLSSMTATESFGTVVIVTTEFGRYFASPTDSGHWPWGYAQILIGGGFQIPNAATDPTRRIVGDIDGQGYARDGLGQGGTGTSPRQFRAAVLHAAGVWPDHISGLTDPLDLPGNETPVDLYHRLFLQ